MSSRGQRLGIAAPVGLALFLATTTWPGAGPAAAQPAELPATVVTVAGATEVFAKGGGKWVPAKLRAELGEGDGVRTLATGRVVLRTGDGHALRLAPLSRLFFAGNDAAGDGPVRVRLDGGWLWTAVTPLAAARPRIEVRAGPVTVAVSAAGAGIRLNRDGSVLVRVYHGAASCSGPEGRKEWERELKGGEELLVSAAGSPGAVGGLRREDAEASWVRWNEEQDAAGYGGPPPLR